jgi:hypothetical protein
LGGNHLSLSQLEFFNPPFTVQLHSREEAMHSSSILSKNVFQNKMMAPLQETFIAWQTQ